MEQNNKQDCSGQTVSPTTTTKHIVTIESASFENMNNIDPALRGDDASSSNPPSDPKKRRRDGEEDEVLGRPKVPKMEDSNGQKKEAVVNPRKRQIASQGSREDWTQSDNSVMRGDPIAQSVAASRTGAFTNSSSTSSHVEESGKCQICDVSSRPICRPKLKINTPSAMSSASQVLRPSLPSDVPTNVLEYPSAPYGNGRDGSSSYSFGYNKNDYQQSGVYQDQGQSYQQDRWNEDESSYKQQFSARLDVQQHDYSTVSSGEQSEIYDLNGQRVLDGGAVMYTWEDVMKYVQDKEIELNMIKDDEMRFLRDTAAANLAEIRQIDRESHTKELNERDEVLNNLHLAFLGLEGSIPGKLFDREQAIRLVCENQYEIKRQEWANLSDAKDTRIQNLEDQLNQLTNAPAPQGQVVIQEDPHVAQLQAQVDSFEAAEVERSTKDGDSDSNAQQAQKVVENLEQALELIKTLRSEKSQLEDSKKELQESVGNMTKENKELTEKQELSESATKDLKTEKDAAEDKISALETHIKNVPEVSPKFQEKLDELLSEITTLKEDVKEVSTLRTQLTESQDNVKILQVVADKVSGLTKDLEDSNEKIYNLELAALAPKVDQESKKKFPRAVKPLPATPISRVPRAAHLSALHLQCNPEAGTNEELDFITNNVEPPARPSIVVAAEKSAPLRLIQLQREMDDLKTTNDKLHKDIRRTSKEKIKVETSLISVMERFEYQKEDLVRVHKIKDKLIRALMLIGIFFVFSILVIPRLLPFPEVRNTTTLQKVDANIIADSPLRSEVLTKIYKLPEEEKTAYLQFDDIYPEYRYGPPEENHNTEESIRITDIYQEYMTIMNERAAKRKFPSPTNSYSGQPSPIQDVTMHTKQRLNGDKQNQFSRAEIPISEEQSAFWQFFEDWLRGPVTITAIGLSAYLWTTARAWFKRFKQRLQEEDAHRKAYNQRVIDGIYNGPLVL